MKKRHTPNPNPSRVLIRCPGVVPAALCEGRAAIRSDEAVRRLAKRLGALPKAAERGARDRMEAVGRMIGRRCYCVTRMTR